MEPFCRSDGGTLLRAFPIAHRATDAGANSLTDSSADGKADCGYVYGRTSKW